MAANLIDDESAPVTPPPFEPATWLDRFRGVGGWWLIGADDKVSVGVDLDGFSDDENETACAMLRGILGDLEQRAFVRAHLLSDIGVARHGHA